MMTDNRKILRMIVVLFAILGCSFQLQSIFVTYFKYSIGTKLISDDDKKFMDTMSLSICTPYADILDYKKLLQLKQIDMRKLTRLDKLMKTQDVLTVKEIFDLTPDEKAIVNYCALRYPSTRIFTRTNNATTCNTLFNVTKYYTQEFMCYMITPKEIDIPSSTLFTTIDSPGEIYLVGLRDEFSSMLHYIKFIVHSSGLPYTSKRYARMSHERKPDSTMFHMFYRHHFLHMLGFPYHEFICSDTPDIHIDCIEHCVMNKSIYQFNRVVHDLDTVIRYKFKHISKTQVSDPTVSSAVDDILKLCSRKCNLVYCHLDRTTTDFSRDDFTSLLILVGTPYEPDSITIQYPSVTFLEVSVYVMGVISAWFGFAFINIDLSVIYSVFKNKIIKRRTQVVVRRPKCVCYRCRNSTRYRNR